MITVVREVIYFAFWKLPTVETVKSPAISIGWKGKDVKTHLIHQSNQGNQ